MYVQTRTSLTCSNLWCKCDVVAILVCEVADDPLRYHELVCGILCVYRKEFDLILFVYLAVDSEVSYLRVTILDLSSSLCNVCHALCAEFIEFSIWS